jgi:hypothetical protein
MQRRGHDVTSNVGGVAVIAIESETGMAHGVGSFAKVF